MDLNQIYTQLILEESRNKKNRREIENPDFEELGHNPSCGDEIVLYIKLESQKIKDISYTGHGCAISQASTSVMCNLVKGMNINESRDLAMKFIRMVKGELENDFDPDELGDAMAFENIQNMPARVKCAVLPWHTLKNILDFELNGKSGEDRS